MNVTQALASPQDKRRLAALLREHEDAYGTWSKDPSAENKRWICDVTSRICELAHEPRATSWPAAKPSSDYLDIIKQQVLPTIVLFLQIRGDSEIEKLLHATLLLMCCSKVNSEYNLIETYPSDDVNSAKSRCTEHSYPALMVLPQAQIGKHRVDFLILASDHRQSIKEPTWRTLVVECDGHEFHERTPDQATRDKRRDRDLQLAGHQVFRFSGRDIWRNPMFCVDQIIQWVGGGLR